MQELQSAFNQLIDSLQDYHKSITALEDQADVDIADNYRNVIDLASVAFECYAQNDPAQPHWVELVSPHRKFGGDNQHARYFFIPLRRNARPI